MTARAAGGAAALGSAAIVLLAAVAPMTPVAEVRTAPSDGQAYDQFGYELATDGSHLIVGSSQNGNAAGAAYLYSWNGTAWDDEQKLVSRDRTKQDRFGMDVDVSGEYALVGAYRHNPTDLFIRNQTYGAAYFYKDTAGGWVEEIKVHASEMELNMEFGEAVALDGDYAVIGSAFADVGPVVDQGRAFVFQNKGGWVETQVLTAPDGHETSYFGQAVEISGDHLFVGSGDHRAGGIDSPRVGAVWVFQRDAQDVWQYRTRLSPADLQDGDAFGISIEAHGEVVVIGAENAWFNDMAMGVAYVFRGTGATWRQDTRLAPSDGDHASFFGQRVAIDGTTIVVGAGNSVVNGDYTRGAAYRFDRSGGTWREAAKLIASDGEAEDYFGHGVTIGGGRISVGANLARGFGNPGPQYVGAVYTYH